MPSGWVKYVVDFDRDGTIDLWGSPADVIGSVANYFKDFNWQPGMPTFSTNSFTAIGAVLDSLGLAHNGPLALIKLL